MQKSIFVRMEVGIINKISVKAPLNSSKFYVNRISEVYLAESMQNMPSHPSYNAVTAQQNVTALVMVRDRDQHCVV